MSNQQLTDSKNQIKATIQRNSNEGYVENRGCIRICTEMMSIIQLVEVNSNPKKTFDIYIMVLLEAVKLFFYADASSGAASEVIRACLAGIGSLCKSADEVNQKYFFDNIIKSAQIRAFKDWPDYGYKLLKQAVCFVHNQEQAQKIYDVFSILGTMYNGKDYPDKLIITLGIIGRLKGREAASKYLMENIHVLE